MLYLAVGMHMGKLGGGGVRGKLTTMRRHDHLASRW